jgi:hypothetical protein
MNGQFENALFGTSASDGRCEQRCGKQRASRV